MKDWSRWVATLSAFVFYFSSVSFPALASPQKSGPSPNSLFANHSLPTTSATGVHLGTMPKLPSLAPALPINMGKSGGLVFNGPSFPTQFNLNLSSVTAAYTANISKSTQIYVGGVLSKNGIVRGGTVDTVTPGQLLTPAQYVALGQVTATGHQSLVLTAAGAASSGFLTLAPAEVSGLSGLYVPTGVSLNSIGFTQAVPLVVTGAASVNGSLYSLQQVKGLTSQLDFGSLTVGAGGLITSNLPRNFSLFSNVVAGNGLAINVSGALHNSGTISTQGTLALSAGGGIYNQAASVMTGSAVSLYSGSGVFANAGLISAAAGNINFASQLNNDINFNNAGGTVSALAGSVNFRDASYNGSANLNISGGNLLANSLNLYSGQGSVDVTTDTVQGVVNVYSGSAHVVTATNDLQLGTMSVSGDPLFYNQQIGGTGGDVTITSDLVFNGQNLAIVAGGNITVNDPFGSVRIDTSGSVSSPSNGGNVYLVAGANINPCSPPCNNSNPMPPAGQALPNTSITVNGPSQTGGRIDLTNVSSINTTGLSGTSLPNSNGGSVVLVAFNGAGTNLNANAGTIKASGVAITTGGYGTGTNGSVVVIAGATADIAPGAFAVQLGTIDTSGGGGAGTLGPALNTGAISIHAAQPMTTAVQFNVDISGNVNVTGGLFLPNTTQYGNVTVSTGALTASGPVQVVSGGTIMVGSVTTNSYPLAPPQSPPQPPGVLIAAGVGQTVAADVILDGSIITNGAPLAIVSSRNIVAEMTGESNVIDTTSPTNGGSVTMIAGTNSTATLAGPAVVSLGLYGTSATGGYIDLTQNAPVSAITTNGASGSLATSGGNVTMVANFGTAATGFINAGSVTIIAGGNAGGNNGFVLVIAGAQSDPGENHPVIRLGDINTAGGVSNPTAGLPSGAVLVYAATPMGGITLNANGSVASGQYNPDPMGFQSVTITSGNLEASGPLQVLGGGNVNVGSLTLLDQFQPTAGGILVAAGVGNPQSAAANNVTLAGSIVTGGLPVAIVASGNIVTGNVDAIRLDTSATTGSGTIATGGGVTMIAGANGAAVASSGFLTISVSGPSTFGGSIDLTQDGGISSFTTMGATGPTAGGGGNVLLAAYTDATGLIGGNVALAKSVTVTTNAGNNLLPSGNVTILAGGADPSSQLSSISFGAIDTSAGAPASGTVFIATQQPMLANGPIIVGGPSATTFINNLSPAQYAANASICFSSINAPGALVQLGAQNNISFSVGVTAGSLQMVSAAGNIGTSDNVLQITVGSLFARAGQDVYLTNNSSNVEMDLSASSTALGAGMNNTFSLSTINGGSIAINAPVMAGTIALTADTTGTITDVATGNLLSGGTIKLQSGSGNIGDPAQLMPLAVAASNSLSANTTGDVLVNQSGNFTLTASSAGSNFKLTAGNSTLTIGDNVSAGNLLYLDAGSIMESPVSGGMVSGKTVTLISSTGDIGSDPTNTDSPGIAISVQAKQTLNVSSANNAYVSQDNSALSGSYVTLNVTTSVAAAAPVFYLITTNHGDIDLGSNLFASTVTINNTNGAINIGSYQVGSVPIAAGSSVTLMTMNGNLTTSDSGLISAADIVLNSCEASIIGTGTSGRVFVQSTSSLTAQSDDDAYISHNGSVNLTNSSAGSPGSGNTFNFVTTNGGDITVVGQLSADNLSLAAGGAGRILQGAAGMISGTAVTLSSTSGNIGTDPNTMSGARLQTSVAENGTLKVTTTGSVFIEQNNNDLILLASSAGAKFDVITAPSSGNDIIIEGGVIVSNSGAINLTADGSIVEFNGTLSAGTINLTARQGSVGSDDSIQTAAAAAGGPGTLSANAGASVNINQTGSVNLVANNGVHNAAGQTFQLTITPDSTTGNGQITVSDTVTAGTIILQSSEGTGTGTGATNIGGIAQGTGGLLTAGTINLSDNSGALGAGTGNGNIGDLIKGAVNTATPSGGTLTLTAVTNGGVYINQMGNLSLSTSSAGPSNDFVLNANGGTLTLINDVSAGNKVSLTAGSIFSDCTVSGTTVYLQSTSGDIGSDPNSNGGIAIAVNASQALTVVSFGNAYVEQTGSNDLNLTNSTAGATSVFEFTSDGGTINLISTGTTPPPLSAAIISLNALNGGINVGSVQVKGTTSVTMMTMNGNLTTSDIGLISGGDVILQACEASIIGSGASGRVFVQSSNSLTAVSDDDAYISHSGSVNLTNSSAGSAGSGNTFDLVTTGGGDITVVGQVSADNLSLAAGGSGKILEGAGGVVSGIAVTLSSTSGNIGADPSTVSGLRLQTAVTENGTLTVTTTGNVFVQQNSNDLTLGTSSAGSKFDLITVSGSNNDIIIAGGVTVSTSGTINLTADGNIVEMSGALSGGTINLVATHGSIGSDPQSGGMRILTIASAGIGACAGTCSGPLPGQLTAIASNGDIFISQSSNVDLAASMASTSKTFDLVTTSNGNIIVSAGSNGVISAGTINLTAGGSGSITEGTGTLSGSMLNLKSTSGDLGADPLATSPVALSTDITGTITANTGGNAYISNSSAVSLGQSNVSGNFAFVGSGTVTVSGAVVGNSYVAIQTAIGSGGGVVLAASVTGGSATGDNLIISADGDGAGTITQTAGTLTGNVVVLASGVGDIGSNASLSSRISTNATFLVINSAANVYVLQAGNVSVSSAPETSAATVDVKTSAGNITVNGDIVAQNVNLYAGGSGSILENSGTIFATNANLNAPSGTIGTGGSLGVPIVTNLTGLLQVTSGTASSDNVYLDNNNSAAFTLGASSAGNNFAVATNGPLVVSAQVQGANVTLASIGGFTLQANGSVSAGTASANLASIENDTSGTMSILGAVSGAKVTLLGTGTSGIAIGAGASVAAGSNSGNVLRLQTASGSISQVPTITLSGNAVQLVSTSGDIGSSGQSMQIIGSTLTASTTGSAYVSSARDVTLMSSMGLTNFSLIVTNGSLTLAGNVNSPTGAGQGTVVLTASNAILTNSTGLTVSGNTVTLNPNNNIAIGTPTLNVRFTTSAIPNVASPTANISLFQINPPQPTPTPTPTPTPVHHFAGSGDESDSNPGGSAAGTGANGGGGNQGGGVSTQTTPQSGEPPSNNSQNLSDAQLGTSTSSNGQNDSGSQKDDNNDNQTNGSGGKNSKGTGAKHISRNGHSTLANGANGNQANGRNGASQINAAIGGTSVGSGQFDGKTIANLRSAGVDIGEGSNNNFVVLNRGNLLFQPNHDMAVRVQEGTVFVPNGATAFVIETGHDVAIYDMHDGHHGSVKVQVGKKIITLAPGKQLVLTRQLAADFDKINPGPRIAYRGAHGEVVAEGIKAYAADFSIPSIMMNVAPLKRMLASDIPSERRAAHKLLKDAVIVAQLTGQAGPYQAGAPATQP